MTAPSLPLPASLAGKYLTVVLDGEPYGLCVLQIREIIRRQKTTPVPQMPAFVTGVINLRGRVIPVVDLRLRLGLAATLDERNCIVVVQVRLAGVPAAQIGLLVDRVEDVVNLSADDIDSTPEFVAGFDRTHLLGMAKVKGSVKMLLDVDQVLGADVVHALTPAS